MHTHRHTTHIHTQTHTHIPPEPTEPIWCMYVLQDDLVELHNLSGCSALDRIAPVISHYCL